MGTNVVNKSDIRKVIGNGSPFRGIASNIIYYAMGFRAINRLYRPISGLRGAEFARQALDRFRIRYSVPEKDIRHIPESGPAVIVSNHPYGGADGLALYETVSRVRPDVKVMTNFVLSKIAPLSDDFLPVNPFEGMKGAPASTAGLKAALRHVEGGGLLIVFPAGEVSSIPKGHFFSKLLSRRTTAVDKSWEGSAMKLIARSGATVVPAYFHGQNRRRFHLAGRIHPFLRTLMLPREFLNAGSRGTIQLRIGKGISMEETASLAARGMLARHLYARCYALEANIPDTNTIEGDNPQKPIVAASRREDLTKEIERARDNGDRLFSTAGYEVFLLGYREYPTIMYELARLREITFRAIGEGTGERNDTDEYDIYYRHLVLWNTDNGEIAGAYRLGIGSEIMESFGLGGFYVDTLFHYRKEMSGILSRSIELGRSFVVPSYQKEIFPLMLLIKGILYTTALCPQTRYLIGPVSISSWYPDLYKSIFVKYLSDNYGRDDLKEAIAPGHRFRNRACKVNLDDLLLDKCGSIEQTDRYIMMLSNGDLRIPALIKRYLKIGVRVIDFNVDPLFNYCVDGLILLDTADVPEKEIRLLLKGEADSEKFMEKWRQLAQR